MKPAEGRRRSSARASGRCSTTWRRSSDPLRCRMLLVLERHELTVSELCAVLQLPQSTVSRHLKTLADAGWVVSRRDGTSRYYSIVARRARCGRATALAADPRAGGGDERRRSGRAAADERARAPAIEVGGVFLVGVGAVGSICARSCSGSSFHLHALLGLLDPAAGRRRSRAAAPGS